MNRRTFFTICSLAVSAFSAANAQAQVTLVSNLDQTTSGSGDVYVSGFGGNFTRFYAAQTFTTGSASATLASIDVSFSQMNFSNTTFSLRLFSNAGSQPGSSIETLSGSTSPSDGVFSYTSSGSTVLAPNTTYWWVASSSTNGVIFHPTFTASQSETSSYGWTIGNVGYTGSTTSPSSLPTFSSISTPFQFSVSAVSAIPEPSTYAALAGLVVLGTAVAIRRRRTLA